MHKLIHATLTLKGIGRCFVSDKHLSAAKIIRRGLVSADHGDSGKNEMFDVIISGGGMVGSAMTCSLGE